ncbi:MAG: LPD38 domain-containing protein [Vicinamibacterales bacterium]
MAGLDDEIDAFLAGRTGTPAPPLPMAPSAVDDEIDTFLSRRPAPAASAPPAADLDLRRPTRTGQAQPARLRTMPIATALQDVPRPDPVGGPDPFTPQASHAVPVTPRRSVLEPNGPTVLGEMSRSLFRGAAMVPGRAVVAGGVAAGALPPELLADVDARMAASPPAVTASILDDPKGTLGNPLWWASAGGQVAGSVAGLMSAGLIGGAPLAALVEAGIEGGNIYADAIAAGATPEQAGAAAAKTTIANAPFLFLTNLPIFSPATKSRILNAALASVSEGGQEAGQAMIANAAAREFDPERPIVSRELADEAIVGALAGPLAAGGVASGRQAQARSDLRTRVVDRIQASERARQASRFPATDPPVAPDAVPVVDAPAAVADVPAPPTSAPAPLAPDVAGEIDAFLEARPVVDTLETGEAQARLPGAVGAVREQETATPQIEAPFSLTREVAEAPTGRQGSLLTAPPVDEVPIPPPAAPAPPPAIPVTPRGRRTLNEPATPVRPEEVTYEERRELRRILREMDEFEFTPRTMNAVEAKQGQSYDVVAGAAGAPVFSDIVTTDSRGRAQGTRGQVITALRRFLYDDTRSALSDRAVEVARRRLQGDATLSKPLLPAEYGDLPYQMELRPREGLTEAERVTERTFARAIERNPERLISDYRERFGNVANSDLAKELAGDLFGAPAARTANSRALHRPSHELARGVFRQILEEDVPEGKSAIAVFTAGGTGSGKSSSLTQLFPGLVEDAHVIYDSTLANTPEALEDVEAALKAGHDVGIVLTLRDVQDAFVGGVLPRAMQEGRPVSIDSHVRTHLGAPATVQAIAQQYAGDPRVSITVVRNETGQERTFTDLSEIEQFRYDEADVRRSLAEALDADVAAGRVSEAVAVATRAARGELAPEAPRAGDRKGPTRARSRQSGRPRGDSLPVSPRRGATLETPLTARTGLTRDLPAPPSTGGPRIPVTGRIRPSEILRDLQRVIGGIPVRTGHFNQRAYGIYKPDVQAIRLKVANNLQTFFHESGHHLDEAVLKLSREAHEVELLALGAETSRPSYTKTQKLQEGAAEFLRRWFTEPDTIGRRAPGYTRAFEAALARPEHADLRRGLEDIRGRVSALISQDLATRGGLRIDRRSPAARRRDAIRDAATDPRTAARRAVRTLATWAIDDLHPVRVAVDAMRAGHPLEYRANAYILARLARGSAGKAEAFLEHGVRARNGKFIAGSLADALTPVRDALEPFGNYLVALRALELHRRDIEPGMTRAEAEAIVADAKGRDDFAAFEQSREAVYAYQAAMLEYARQYGGLSAQQVKAIHAVNEFYVPMQRVLDDVGDALSGGVARRVANRGLPVKRIKGSGRDIIDPLESIVKNTFTVVDMVEKNRAMLALVRLAEGGPDSARWLEKIPTPKAATRFKLNQLTGVIKRSLSEMGVGEVNPERLAKGLRKATDGVTDEATLSVAAKAAAAGAESVGFVPANLDEFLDELVTVWTPQQFATGKDDIVTVIRNGKREFWQVNDRALYDAVTAMGSKATTTLMQTIGRRGVQLLRDGATLTPGFFTATNPLRDTVGAYVQSRYGFVPLVDTVIGALERARNGEVARLFYTSGVGQATLASQHRDAQQRAIRRLTRRDLRRVVTSPVDLLRAASQWTEEATRLGEFRLALQAGGVERGILGRLFGATHDGPMTEEVLARATLAARDVTTDFSRGGRRAKEVSEYKAFFNANVQGWVRMAEASRRDPLGVGLKLGSIMALSAALWFLNEDDDEYQELPAWEKASFWHFRTRDGFWKFPKPFQWGLAADAVEASLDLHRAAQPTRLREMRESLVGTPGQLIGTLLPTVMLPIAEAGFNYSTFRDAPIVNPWDVNAVDADLQYTDWTSETAKILGRSAGVSPAKIDHIIFGYTAGLGRGTVGALDEGLSLVGIAPRKNLPAKPTQQVPVVGRLRRDAAFESGSQSVQDLYDVAEAIAKVEGSVKRDLESGRRDSALARVAKAEQALPWQRREAIKAARKAFRDLGQRIDAIYAAPPERLTPEAKRAQLDAVYRQMTSIARVALGRPALAPAAGE